MELTHQPWIKVWTHDSDTKSYGGDNVEHLSLDVEDCGPQLYHVSGTVTEKDAAPKEFGAKNLVAIAVLDFADQLAEKERKELLALLQKWSRILENPPK